MSHAESLSPEATKMLDYLRSRAAALGPDEIRIAGVSFANAAITDLMRDLESSSELQRVRLVEIARARRDSLDVQQFTLVATFEGYRIPTLTADSTAGGGRPEIEPADRPEDGEDR